MKARRDQDIKRTRPTCHE